MALGVAGKKERKREREKERERERKKEREREKEKERKKERKERNLANTKQTKNLLELRRELSKVSVFDTKNKQGSTWNQ